MPPVGLLHPGEMGAAVAAGWIEAGHQVRWASAGRSAQSARRAAAAGLVDVGTVGALAASCPLVISLCPPQAAAAVAEQVAGTGFGGVYVDANAVSPATTRAVADTVTARGARYVDGAVIGPPPTRPGTTRLYLSGTHAVEVSAALATPLLEVHVVSETIGAASALKLSYAAWTKGTAALLVAIRAAAAAEGVEAALLDEWRTSLPELAERSVHASEQAERKGWRWEAEMEEIAAMFAGLGLPDGFHRAAARVFAQRPWRAPREP